MIRHVTALVIALALPPGAIAQTGGEAGGTATPPAAGADSLPAAAVAPAAPAVSAKAKAGPSKIYYGGSIGLTLGDYVRVSIQPMIGYKFTPKFSAGGKVTYEYVRDSRYTGTSSSNNYGFGVFGRYRFIPQLYGHAEFTGINYDVHSASGASQRDWVPFLYLGGGYAQQMGKNVSAYAEVLVDVLQDDRSPYQDWEPQLSFGIGIGF